MGLLIKIPFMDNIVHLFQSERDKIQAKQTWLVLVYSTSPAPTLQNLRRSQLSRVAFVVKSRKMAAVIK